MSPEVIINRRVEVVAVFKSDGKPSGCFPARMKYQGQLIEFTELGLRHPTAKGRRMIHVFDVSDGANDYRLEFDAERLSWTLAALLEGHDETGA